ncbi:MAG: sensor histidine kinase KdpD [Parachlamydiaceae bacterium]|nr:sensor histidine kinase KdpD [Parachlamydiaceae bacterium]
MTRDDRPTPEEFLEVLKQEESAAKKGRLKVFLGMAAGVGKTFTMLQDAQQLQKNGTHVVVGIVNTHGRQETANLLKGLSIIPPKLLPYKDKEFEELDLDTILALKPDVVLIDELAHTNIPGSRHLKRWQDVEEILENGIDVHTTLNVQHIESLKETVEKIAGVSVRETVPDLIIETATFIQIVDITPEGLLQRLKEGKVYFGDQSEIAARHFFQKEQMAALRELVLRYTAQKIDHDLTGVLASAERTKGWKTRDKLLVSVSPTLFSQSLIRTTRRLAFQLDASWLALYVDDGRQLSDKENSLLVKNLALAHELGGEIVTINDPDVISGIKKIATQRGASQIILGRPRTYSFLRFFNKTPLFDRLAKECPDIDIHIIKQDPTWEPLTLLQRQGILQVLPSSRQIFGYIFALSVVFGTSVLSWMLVPIIGYKFIGIIFLLSILLLSLVCKKGPILVASTAFALIWNFFFIPPINAFNFEFNEDTALILLYFFTAIVTGTLIERTREHLQVLTRQEQLTSTLNDIISNITTSPSLQEGIKTIKERLSTVINGKFEILIKQVDNHLVLDKSPFFITNEKEESSALWVFQNSQEAGWSTSTLPTVRNLYIPIKGFHETLGVLIYRPAVGRVLNPEEKHLLYTVTQQLGNYIERIFAEYKIIFQSVSQEQLRDLERVISCTEELKRNASPETLSCLTKLELASKDLLHIFTSITTLIQLHAGKLINKHQHAIKSILNTCQNSSQSLLGEHSLKISVQDDLPLVSLDASLIEVAINNLILYAIKNSPSTAPIEIDVHRTSDSLVISLVCTGMKVPIQLVTALNEKFYRIPGTIPPGINVDLTLVKRIAETHQGYLFFENESQHLTYKISLILPLKV